MPILTDANLLDLIDNKPITAQLPWASRDSALISAFYRGLVRTVRSTHWLGGTITPAPASGYASFIEASFSREGEHQGLAVFFSKLAPYYVIGEGRKGVFLLDYERVDRIEHYHLEALVTPVCAIFDNNGLLRLRQADLAYPLPGSCYGSFYTMITQPPWRHFDALFHWVD